MGRTTSRSVCSGVELGNGTLNEEHRLVHFGHEPEGQPAQRHQPEDNQADKDRQGGDRTTDGELREGHAPVSSSTASSAIAATVRSSSSSGDRT